MEQARKEQGRNGTRKELIINSSLRQDWNKEGININSSLRQDWNKEGININSSLRQEWNKERIIYYNSSLLQIHQPAISPCAKWNKETILFLAPRMEQGKNCSLRQFV